ncbi:MAG: inorganic diphosphatase [Candidatus Phytoplasma stylosanthis]|uniref:inorganic diphosphatase n=1 Tax=Candidatus Phytoplasma stylosanthis TaxID=2798314 RepID=UPI0029395821|nr:inorganic diphosphatase [Candidatus Phytoplasma stylosanthis]MDV3168172.1 inorganic diphosphatase [Candidatus Phytoplasma stylosanthis]MDV3171086.1 inorganic diphosphatase [Candidatus Phytoplasma stylosanthis]MDV3173563.1 inorganic diphosphatase [Candidatus Phytoplasma stylosanthis]MDV3174377.1 inorganic diphosphatase [Candidatus Phytoplasma stylosanthis]MDV3202468.1 inorganic diphosphatase [Candidatus Phytoplasma stylosanthis]
MVLLNNISSERITENSFLVMIEISKGSRKKYELDKETCLLKLDRILRTSFVYPSNYGFIPLTYCEDKDPLDVFVLSQEILDPMVLVQCRPIGVIEIIDNGEIDNKIIAVPNFDSSMQNYQDIKDVPFFLLEEIKHFLIHYKDLENKKVLIKKIEDKNKSLIIIKESLSKYKKLKK